MLSGLLGVGGGIIFVPVFDFLFYQKGIRGSELVKFTLANSFLVIFFSGIISSIKHRQHGNFHFKEILFIAIPAIVSGGFLSEIIRHSSWYNKDFFNGIFIALLLLTLVRMYINQRSQSKFVERPFSAIKYIIIGIITGAVSAFSGLGGGVVMLPLLTIFMKMDIKKASSISIGVIPILALSIIYVYGSGKPETILKGSIGYLQLIQSIPVIIGIAIGSPIGVSLAKRAKSSRLHAIFAALLIVMSIKYLIEIFVK
ncbi:MAG: sulfite exporter TauE/SafE family protein [Flavobacteriales bacterium]|nr:sulfite exporter TauE/SafE family protein [Flavobacteriales bacterium]